MTNPYYNGPSGITPFTRARAEDITANFMAIADGFDLMQTGGSAESPQYSGTVTAGAFTTTGIMTAGSGIFTNASFNGSAFFGDSRFYKSIVGGAPRDTYDTNDYVAYDRGNNLYNWVIDSVVKMQLGANELLLPSSNLALQAGKIFLRNFDAAERSVNFVHSNGRNIYSYVNANDAGFYDSVLGSVWSWGHSTDQQFRIRGQIAWHAGNFNPASYMPTAGGNFSGSVGAPAFVATAPGAGTALLTPGTGSNTGHVDFFAASGARQGYVGFVSTNGPVFYQNDTGNGHRFGGGALNSVDGLLVNGQPVWHAGNFNPGLYAPLSGTTFSGNIAAPRIFSSSDGSGQNIAVGNDTWLGDINEAATLSVRGQADASSGLIAFGTGGSRLGVQGAGDIGVYSGNFRVDDGRAFILGPDTYIVRSGGRIVFVVNGVSCFSIGTDATRQTTPALWRQGGVV